MAKRAPANETPYSPLDPDLARSVMDGAPAGMEEKTTASSQAAKPPEQPRKPRPFPLIPTSTSPGIPSPALPLTVRLSLTQSNATGWHRKRSRHCKY